MRKLAIAAVIALGVVAAQDVVIRGGVALVDLLVTVRDKKGALAKNLKQSDFRILEEGQEQQITRFARETDLPLTIGMLVDVSGSVAKEVSDERRAARQFFTQVLRPQDQAFIIGFSRTAELLQDTTDSIQKLQQGLDDLLPPGKAANPSQVVFAQFPGRFPLPIPGPGRGRVPGPRPGGGRTKGPGRGPGRGAVLGGTVLYDAVFLAADEVLRPATGRKAIILITDGEDQGSLVPLSRALEAAVKSDVIIYSIFVKPDRRGGTGEDVLERLSGETGGRVFRMEKRNLEKIFNEINEELRSQYSISYSPTNTARDGAYRLIEIQMADKSMKTQARKGYYAAGRE